ncbi:MAG: M3 family metallopeptidase, partial [Nanoarchaeota archaeon]|nr:M3 family metallopeptidase [Nanoarchaeota archaeon]
IIADKLDDLYASIPRQAYFVIYEQEAHKKIHEGTTIEQLNTTYLKNLKEQFGNSIELPKQFQHEWLSIPHIYHTPYYCYAYSFGNLLTLALYQRYKEEGQPFVKDYLQFLSHGGSKKPAAIAEELNIDFNNKQFWKAGYEQIQQLVEQLKTSVRQL